MAPLIVLLMHFPIFRCSISTIWLQKLPRPRTPSVHGRSSSWGTPQQLPKTRGCYINTADIPSWNQSTSSVLCSVYYPILPSFTTYPTLFLLLFVSYKIIKVYLAGICLEHLERGFEDPTKDKLLRLLCTGIKCSNSYSPTHYHHSPPNIEVTAPPRLSFLPSWETFAVCYPIPEVQHVQRTGNAYTIFIEQFKTDPFRCGHSITIYASGTSTCLVKALQLYAEAVPQHQGNAPIFKGGRFSPLNRQQLTNAICHLLQSISYNKQYYFSHSGAATTAAAAGLPDWFIKALGRWNSNPYQLYIWSSPFSAMNKILILCGHMS